MRSLITSYLAVGVVMMLVGLFGTGPCPNKNTDMLSDLIFVLGWPGYLYKDVINGPLTTAQLLHQQACAGGVVVFPAATYR
jgi:hypothetical protein